MVNYQLKYLKYKLKYEKLSGGSNQTNFTTEIPIPSHLVGKFIGSGGKHINDLKEHFKVKRIRVSEHQGSHKVIVQGSHDAVKYTIDFIKQFITENEKGKGQRAKGSRGKGSEGKGKGNVSEPTSVPANVTLVEQQPLEVEVQVSSLDNESKQVYEVNNENWLQLVQMLQLNTDISAKEIISYSLDSHIHEIREELEQYVGSSGRPPSNKLIDGVINAVRNRQTNLWNVYNQNLWHNCAICSKRNRGIETKENCPRYCKSLPKAWEHFDHPKHNDITIKWGDNVASKVTIKITDDGEYNGTFLKVGNYFRKPLNGPGGGISIEDLKDIPNPTENEGKYEMNQEEAVTVIKACIRRELFEETGLILDLNTISPTLSLNITEGLIVFPIFKTDIDKVGDRCIIELTIEDVLKLKILLDHFKNKYSLKTYENTSYLG